MNRSELVESIRNGESSGLEFKRDDVRPERLAREIAALLNLEGGHILLGVEDDGEVTGLLRSPREVEEWAMEIARTHVRPATIPYWSTVDWGDGRTVGIVSLSADAPDKPYKARRGSAWMTQVRVGTTTRDATDEEEARLYMQSGRLPYDRKPTPGASFDDLDLHRLVNYFRDLRQQPYPRPDDVDAWTRLLVNTDLMVEVHGRIVPTTGGLLLFGRRPNRHLPQAGISVAAWSGTEKDYDARERGVLRGPIVSRFPGLGEAFGGEAPTVTAPPTTDSPFAEPMEDMDWRYPRLPQAFSDGGDTLERGIIERSIDFVHRNIGVEAWIEGGRRMERRDYPLEAVREAIVNAVAHRDYTITVCDIELSIYADRLEVVSPGRLPNTVTVDKMRAGYRASRDELVKDVLRDYRYIEATGLGVPRKIVAGMHAHNGTEPDLIEEESRFTVRPRKTSRPT